MPARKKAAPPKGYNPDQPAPALPKTNYSKRYDDVKPVIDSGMTVPKLIAQLKNRMPTGEIFRRIRPKKLVQLLNLHAYELEAKQRSTDPVPSVEQSPASCHHMHSSVVFYDGPRPSAPAPAEPVSCPFLLLDVRGEDDFSKCHIQNAQCYPKARLSRATGQFSQEILSFRGKPKSVIVVYCDYGAVSADAAQQFAEREFDNIFLLHGGLAEFAQEFPELVGPGEPPQPEVDPKATVPRSGSGVRKQTPVEAPARKVSRAAQAVAAQPGSKKIWK
jgi:centrosomal protein CEP41